jgi:putative FmdB family regulatory protein
MPTYEYICQACNHEFELFQQMSDAVKRKCPECGKLKLQRLIGTGAGVIFKGGGFYETDYRSESYKKAAEAEKKSASNGEAAKTTASEGASSTSSNDHAKPASGEKKPKPASDAKSSGGKAANVMSPD